MTTIINKFNPKAIPYTFKPTPTFKTNYDKQKYWEKEKEKWIKGMPRLIRKQKRQEYMAKYRANPNNKEREKARRKKAYWKNKNGLRDKMKAYYEANKEHLSEKAKEYKKKNPQVRQKSQQKCKERNIIRHREERKELKDHYIVSLITQHTDIDTEIIRNQPKLIELYRQNVILKRKINESIIATNTRQSRK